MKLLVAACMTRQIAEGLKAEGHDVVAVADWPKDPGDEAILAFARRESRVIITRDKDFGALAVQFGISHQGVLQIRRVPLRAQTQFCLQALSAHEMDLNEGAVVTIQPGRIRVRKRSR